MATKRINHSEHDHPKTKQAYAACRKAMLASGEAEPVAVRKGRKSPRKPAASKVTIPKVPALTLDLDTIRGITESLDNVEQELQTFASLEGAAISLTIDGSPVLVTYAGNNWHVGIG